MSKKVRLPTTIERSTVRARNYDSALRKAKHESASWFLKKYSIYVEPKSHTLGKYGMRTWRVAARKKGKR